MGIGPPLVRMPLDDEPVIGHAGSGEYFRGGVQLGLPVGLDDGSVGIEFHTGIDFRSDGQSFGDGFIQVVFEFGAVPIPGILFQPFPLF